MEQINEGMSEYNKFKDGECQYNKTDKVEF